MNLIWNAALGRFEAQFDNFQEDLAAAKAAGFKTDGAPEWAWYTYKAGPLTKLRTHRPALLTISPEARAQYDVLWPTEEKNAKLKAELAAHNKELKKKLDKEKKIEEQEGKAFVIPEKGYIDASDLPPMPPLSKTERPPYQGPLCVICKDPVCVWEYPEGGVQACLWCQKIVLDSATEVC